jgi:hypothetical protein
MTVTDIPSRLRQATEALTIAAEIQRRPGDHTATIRATRPGIASRHASASSS